MAWLEARDSGAMFPGFQPGEPPPHTDLAIQGWNLMGGLDWQALPYVVEMLGIVDVEAYVYQLNALRDHQNKALERG